MYGAQRKNKEGLVFLSIILGREHCQKDLSHLHGQSNISCVVIGG